MIIAKEKYKHFNIVWISETPPSTNQLTDAITEAFASPGRTPDEVNTQLNELIPIIQSMTEMRKRVNRRRLLGDYESQI